MSLRRRCCATLAVTVLAAAVACVPAAAAGEPPARPDYAREARWADEVVPSLMVGDAVYLDTPDRKHVLALYTKADGVEVGAAVIVHGLGVQPDFGVIGELRSALAERGVATLSVQMPVLGAEALPAEYAALFPIAGDRIDVAVRWLAAKEGRPVAIVAHSLGAAMANAWLARPQHAPVAAFVAIGMGVPFATTSLPPVLDIVAERDLAPVRANAPLRALALGTATCSATRKVAGADHYLDGHGAELADVIVPFLARASGDDCRH
jgi:alpha/beta superfamily hydrolase